MLMACGGSGGVGNGGGGAGVVSGPGGALCGYLPCLRGGVSGGVLGGVPASAVDLRLSAPRLVQAGGCGALSHLPYWA